MRAATSTAYPIASLEGDGNGSSLRLLPAAEPIAAGDILDRYRQTRADALKAVLVERFLYLVEHVAEAMAHRFPRQVDVEDLIQYGSFGLLAAIDGFDGNRGVKFETYAQHRIRGAILDGLRELDLLSRSGRTRVRMLAEASELLAVELGRDPSEMEIAARLGIDEEEIRAIRILGHAAETASLDTPFNGIAATGTQSLRDTIAALESSDPARELELHELREVLQGALQGMQLEVYRYYVVEKMGMAEIGVLLNISESRVCQLFNEAVGTIALRLQRARVQEPDSVFGVLAEEFGARGRRGDVAFEELSLRAAWAIDAVNALSPAPFELGSSFEPVEVVGEVPARIPETRDVSVPRFEPDPPPLDESSFGFVFTPASVNGDRQ